MLIPGRTFFLFTHFQILFIGYLLAKEFQRHQDQHLLLMRKLSSAHHEITAERNVVFLLSCDEDNNCRRGKSLKKLFSSVTAKNSTLIFVQICADHLKRHESKKTNFVSYFIEEKDCFKIAEALLSSCEKEVISHLLKKKSILLGTIVKDKVPLPFITSKKEFSRQFPRELYPSLKQSLDSKSKEDFKMEDNYFIPCFNFEDLENFCDNCCCKCCLSADISNYIMRKLFFKKIKRYTKYVRQNNFLLNRLNRKNEQEDTFSKNLFCIYCEDIKVICKHNNKLCLKDNVGLKYLTNFLVRKKRQIPEQKPKHSSLDNHDIKNTNLFNQHLYNRYHFLPDKYELLSSKLEKQSVKNSTNETTASVNMSEKINKYEKGFTISKFLSRKRRNPHVFKKDALFRNVGKHLDEILSNSQLKNTAQTKNETSLSFPNVTYTTEEVSTKQNSSLSTNNETTFDEKTDEEAYNNIQNSESSEISNTFKTNISLNSESKLNRKEESKMIYSSDASRKNNSTANSANTNHPPVSKNEFNFDFLNRTNFKSLDNNNKSTSSIKFTDTINDYLSNEQKKNNLTTDSTHFSFDEMLINNKTIGSWHSKKSSTITSNSKSFSDNFRKEDVAVKQNGKNILPLNSRNVEPSTSINGKESPFEATDKINKFTAEEKIAEKNKITNSYKFSTLTMSENHFVNSNLNESTASSINKKGNASQKLENKGMNKSVENGGSVSDVYNISTVAFSEPYDDNNYGKENRVTNSKKATLEKKPSVNFNTFHEYPVNTFSNNEPKIMKTDILTVQMDTYATEDFTPKISFTIASTGNPFINSDNSDFHRDEFTNHGTNKFSDAIQTDASFEENTHPFSTLDVHKTVSTKRSPSLNTESFGFENNDLLLTQNKITSSTSLRGTPDKSRTTKFNGEEMFTIKSEFNPSETSEKSVIKAVLPSEDSSSAKTDNVIFLETDANDRVIVTDKITSIDDLNFKNYLIQSTDDSKTERDSFKQYSKSARRNIDLSIIEDVSSSLNDYFFSPVESTFNVRDSSTFEELNKITTKGLVSDIPSEKIRSFLQLPSSWDDRTILNKLGREETEIIKSNMNKITDAESFLFTKYDPVSTINDMFKDISTEKEVSKYVINKNLLDDHASISTEFFPYSSENSPSTFKSKIKTTGRSKTEIVNSEISTNKMKKVTQLYEDRIKSVDDDGKAFTGTELSTGQNPNYRDDADNRDMSNEGKTVGNKQTFPFNEDEAEIDEASTLKHKTTGTAEEEFILKNKNEFSSKQPGVTITELLEYDSLITKDNEISSNEEINSQKVRTTSTIKNKITENNEEQFSLMNKDEFPSKIPDFIETASLEDELSITKGEQISNIGEIIRTQKVQTNETSTMTDKVTQNTEEGFLLTDENELLSKMPNSTKIELLELESFVTRDGKVFTNEGGTQQVQITDNITIKNKIGRDTEEDILLTDENEFSSKIPSARETELLEFESSVTRNEKVSTSEGIISAQQIRTSETSTMKNKISRSTEEEFLLTDKNEFSSKTPSARETELLEFESSITKGEEISSIEEMFSMHKPRTNETSTMADKVTRKTEEEFHLTDDNELSSRILVSIDTKFEEELPVTKNEKNTTSAGIISTRQVQTTDKSTIKNKIERSTEEEILLTDENEFSSAIIASIETEFKDESTVKMDEQNTTNEPVSTLYLLDKKSETLIDAKWSTSKQEISSTGKIHTLLPDQKQTDWSNPDVLLVTDILSSETERIPISSDETNTYPEEEKNSFPAETHLTTPTSHSDKDLDVASDKILIRTDRDVFSSINRDSTLENFENTDFLKVKINSETDTIPSSTSTININKKYADSELHVSSVSIKNFTPSNKEINAINYEKNKQLNLDDKEIISSSVYSELLSTDFSLKERGITNNDITNPENELLRTERQVLSASDRSNSSPTDIFLKKNSITDKSDETTVSVIKINSTEQSIIVINEGNMLPSVLTTKESNTTYKYISNTEKPVLIITENNELRSSDIPTEEISITNNNKKVTNWQKTTIPNYKITFPAGMIKGEDSTTNNELRTTQMITEDNKILSTDDSAQTDTITYPSTTTNKILRTTRRPASVRNEDNKSLSDSDSAQKDSTTYKSITTNKVLRTTQRPASGRNEGNESLSDSDSAQKDSTTYKSITTNKVLRTTQRPASLRNEGNKSLSDSDSAQKDSTTYKSITTNKVLRTTQRPASVRNEDNKSLSDRGSAQKDSTTYKSITTNKVLRTTQRPASLRNEDNESLSDSDSAQKDSTTYKSITTNKVLRTTQRPASVRNEDNKSLSGRDSAQKDSTTYKSITTNKALRTTQRPASLRNEGNKSLSDSDSAQKDSTTYKSITTNKALSTTQRPASLKNEDNKSPSDSDSAQKDSTTYKSITTNKALRTTQRPASVRNEDNESLSDSDSAQKDSTTYKSITTNKVLRTTQRPASVKNEDKKLPSFDDSLQEDSTTYKSVKTTDLANGSKEKTYLSSEGNILSSFDTATGEYITIKEYLSTGSTKEIILNERQMTSSTETAKPSLIRTSLSQISTNGEEAATVKVKFQTERQELSSSEGNQDGSTNIATEKANRMNEDENADQVDDELIRTERQVISASQGIMTSDTTRTDKKEVNTYGIFQNTTILSINNISISNNNSVSMGQSDPSINSADDISTIDDISNEDTNLGAFTDTNILTSEKHSSSSTEISNFPELNSDVDDNTTDQDDKTTDQREDEIIRTERQAIASSQGILTSDTTRADIKDINTNVILQNTTRLIIDNNNISISNDNSVSMGPSDLSINSADAISTIDNINNAGTNSDVFTGTNILTSEKDTSSSTEISSYPELNLDVDDNTTDQNDKTTDKPEDGLIRTERQASSQVTVTSDTTRTDVKDVNTAVILQNTTMLSINNNNISISNDNSVSMGRSDLSINSADAISTIDNINNADTNSDVFTGTNILTSEKDTSTSTEISSYPELNSDVDDNTTDQEDKRTDQLEDELIRTERQISSSEESQDFSKSLTTGKDGVISKDDENIDQIGNEIIPTEMEILSTSQEIIPTLPMTTDKEEANTIDALENTSELNIENTISSEENIGEEETEISSNDVSDISTNGDIETVNINLDISTASNAITAEESTDFSTETNMNTELNSDVDDEILDQDGTTIQLDDELIRTERQVISSSQALSPSTADTTENEEADTKNIFQTKNELSTLKTDLNMPTDRNVISEIPDMSANNTNRDFPKGDANGNINVNVDISTDLNLKTTSTDNFGSNTETNSELDPAEETSVDFEGMPTELSPPTDTTVFMKPTTSILTPETKTEKPLPTTTKNEIITNSELLSSPSTSKTLSEANEKDDLKTTITDIITSLLPTTIKPEITSTVDQIYSENKASSTTVSQLPEIRTDVKFSSTASSATMETEKSTTSLHFKTTMASLSSPNEDNPTPTFTTTTLTSEISPIPFHFTIDADYDKIVGSRKEQFEENLWRQLVIEMRLPFECVQNMEVSKGSIEVNFDLVPNPQLGHIADEKALNAAADELKRMIDSGQLKISDIEGNSLVVVPIDPPTKAPAATEQTSLILGIVIGAFILTVISVAVAVIIMKRKANGIHRLTPIEEARSKLPSYREIPFQEALFMKGPAKNKLMLGKYCYSTGKWLGPGPEPMSYIPPESAVYRPPTDSEVGQTPRPPTAVRERLKNHWELDWDSMVISR